MKLKKSPMREILHGFTSGLIDVGSFNSANEFGNPEKFFSDIASDQADLNFVSCVLTEQGRNNNGQYFSQDLLLTKHASSRLKPFNIEHDKTEIIGTIYDSVCANDKNEPILDEDIEINGETGKLSYKGEGKIRVLIAAALYNMIGRDEVPRIVQDVKEGKKVDVSMEAWFSDFDYILIANDESTQTVKYNDESKYLEEYIGRIFNGKAVAKDYHKKNFIFGGIGQVSKGACPASVFLAAASLKENHEIEGPSVFGNMNINSMDNLFSILSNEQKEQLNKLVLSSNQIEGEDEMKKKRLDSKGNPALDAEGKEIFDNVEEGASAADALISNIQSQANTIAEQNNTIKDLEKKGNDQAAEIVTLNKKIETASAEEKERADNLDSELKTIKKEAKASNYLLKLSREHSDLPVLDEASLREKFSSDNFDDKEFDSFVSLIKASEEDKQKAVASLQKKTLCDMFGLDPDKTTDEELSNAQASLKSKLTVSSESVDPPVSKDNSFLDGVRKTIQASKSKETTKPTGGYKIKTHDTETGKREEITIK